MIDLTPLEVRKKKTDFRRIMRGYDPVMVDDFLELVADRLDQLVRENMALKERTARQEQQVADFRERERALTEALVTAQEMREEIRKQTTREADLARQAAEQESSQLRAVTQQEVAQLRTTAEQEVAQLRARAQQEVAQLRATAQQEAQELRSTARQEREREEEALRRLRAQQQHYVTTYRTLLERELAELSIAAQTLGVGLASVGDAPPAAPAADTSAVGGGAERPAAGTTSGGVPSAGASVEDTAAAVTFAAAVLAAESLAADEADVFVEIEVPPAPSRAAETPTPPAAAPSRPEDAGVRTTMFPEDPLSDDDLAALDEDLDVFGAAEAAFGGMDAGAPAPFPADEFGDEASGAGAFEPEPFEPEPFEPEPFVPEHVGEEPVDAVAAGIEAALADAEAAALSGLSLELEEVDQAGELELYEAFSAPPDESGVPGPIGLGTETSSTPPWPSPPEWSQDSLDMAADTSPAAAEEAGADDGDASDILRNAAAAGYSIDDDELLLDDAVLDSDDEDDGWLGSLLEDDK